MQHVQAMLASHPQARGRVDNAVVRCIEACFDCAQTCISCADACLDEAAAAGLARCIRLNLDCANACAATGPALSRHTGGREMLIRQLLETCAALCRACADECGRHAQAHEHCRICAEACRLYERACEEAAISMGAIGP
jgi:uncharacterized membrane protein